MLKNFLCAITALTLAAASPAISWGLSPTTNEQVPAAPDGVQTLLSQYNGLYHSATEDKKVFFTFDLGYEAGYTAEVLDILKENNIEAIFFLCGNYLKQKELVDRMIAEGHQIGNHTDRHKDLPKLSADGITADIMDFQNDFTAQYPNATPPVYFRPPKGRFDEKTLKIANDNNLKTMLWSIAIVDWGKNPINASASANKIASRIHPGAIILFHITNSGTPEMLKLLIPQIIEKGYTVASPDEL